MEVPFSPEELKYIAELDGEADAKIPGAEMPANQRSVAEMNTLEFQTSLNLNVLSGKPWKTLEQDE